MSTDLQKIVLVIPCYNEAERLPTIEIASFVKEKNGQIGIILVNDGSTDSTGEIINAIAADTPMMRTLHLPRNQGKAEAVRQGILTALKDDADWVGFWDADLATPLEELDRFIAEKDNRRYEAVVGCRLARLGSLVKRRLSRHYLGRVFATTVSCLLRIPLYDSQCGAKIFSRGLAEKVFERPFISRWLFDVEIFRRIVRIYGREKTQACIYECPLFQWTDVAGSKLTLLKMLQTPLELWKIFRSPL